MREKITREEFLKLKEKMIEKFSLVLNIMEQDHNIDRDDENYGELVEDFYKSLYKKANAPLMEYKELLEKIVSYDLSGISAKDWEGITLLTNKTDEEIVKIRADFSDTFANFDFSIMQVMGDDFDFHSCTITNLDKATEIQQPLDEIFDEKAMIENSDQFLSETLPEDVRDRFYSKKLTLKDLSSYEEVFEKAKGHISYDLPQKSIEKLLDKMSFSKFQKIDLRPVELLGHTVETVIERAIVAEEIDGDIFNEYINDEIRQRIIKNGHSVNYVYSDEFKSKNPDLLYKDENPEFFNEAGYYDISLEKFYQYPEQLRGKKFAVPYQVQNLLKYIGEDLKDSFTEVLTYEQAKFFLEVDWQSRKNNIVNFEKILELDIPERVAVLQDLVDTKMGEDIEKLEQAANLKKVIEEEKIKFKKHTELIKKARNRKFNCCRSKFCSRC